MCSFDVIIEGEECVTCHGNSGNGCKVCLLFFTCEHLGLLCEESFPVAVSCYVLMVIGDINVDSVISVRSAYALTEGEVKNLFALAEEPVICLLACEACAVDSGLLACANADCLSVVCVAYGVGLCILKSDKCDDKVALSSFCEFLVICNYVGKKLLIDSEVVSSLLECDTEHVLCLLFSGNVVGIDLNDIVVTLLLCLEDLKCFVCIAGSDDTVGNLALNEESCCSVANVGKCDPVAK